MEAFNEIVAGIKLDGLLMASMFLAPTVAVVLMGVALRFIHRIKGAVGSESRF